MILFLLQEHILNPYTATRHKGTNERIFNHRLYGPRIIVVNKVRNYFCRIHSAQKSIFLEPEKVTSFLLSSNYLHAFLLKINSTRNTLPPIWAIQLQGRKTTFFKGSYGRITWNWSRFTRWAETVEDIQRMRMPVYNGGYTLASCCM